MNPNYFTFSDGVTVTKDELLEAYAVTYTSASEWVTLGEGDETIYAGGGNDTINAAGGNDVIYGEAGSDSLKGGTGSDSLYGGTDADTLSGEDGSDLLSGGDGDDILYGGSGDDTLDGGAGDDYLYGGVGNDTYVFWVGSGQDTVAGYDSTSGRVDTIKFSDVTSTALRGIRLYESYLVMDYGTSDSIFIESGYNSSDQSYGVTHYTFSDNVTITKDQLFVLSNNSESQTYGDSPEMIYAGDGNDTISGGGGNDTIYGENGNDIISGGAGIDYINGGAGNDTLEGGIDADILVGGTGTDTMTGGAGNDTYIVDNTGDVVTENASEGTDTVQSSITYTLGANVENLTLTGTTSLWGTGNDLNNVIIGNSANNILTGGAGNDTLDGQGGADTIKGGLGDDTCIVDNTGDVVTENASEGTDTVQSSITYTLGANVENLTLTGTTSLWGTGNDLNNVIIGNSAENILTGGAGNDTLDGQGGADTIKGGLGDDTCIVDNTGDVVTENASEGTDTVQSSITYTLGANAENLTLTGTSAINGTGNTLNNYLTGNSAVNTLTGDAGNDTLKGGAGNDSLVGGIGSDTYIYSRTDGQDTLNDYSTTTTDADILQLTDGITSTEPVIVKQDGDLYIFVDSGNYVKIASHFSSSNYGIERLEVSDGHYITRSDIETIVNAMSEINSDKGMDVMQKYNAMMSDQTYISTLAQTWHHV